MKLSLSGRLCVLYVMVGVALRMVLVRTFGPAGFGVFAWLGLTLVGAGFDTLVALVAVAVPRAIGAVIAVRYTAHWLLRYAVASLVAAGLLYEAAVEYFFFDEFNVRFNHIAVDYVLYPHEVFGNLWQSFNVGRYAVEAFLAGMVLAPLLVPRCRAAKGGQPEDVGTVAVQIGTSLIVGLAAFVTLWFLPASVVEDRVANEVALNGPVQLGRALWNASLNYRAFYVTHPPAEAHQRAARVLVFPVAERQDFGAPDLRLVRHLKPTRAKPLRSVVVVLEESLGSEFVGCLGAKKVGLTPELDRWAQRGLMLTNLFATGNRTVRGLESVLCSMVPLPGDSIVKRTLTDQVDGLPTVLRRAGYRTAFFYGGRGLFDNLRKFASAIGFESFFEQRDYPPSAFTTAWGVADEYIFDAALARQLAAQKAGEKLFVTVLSVSNHKPFLVPPGHADGLGERNRHVAVHYADWALGKWLAAMESHGLLEDTAVLIVGDHGARVYGSERIPIRSYRIPALFLVPDAQWHGKRFRRLCSQIDLCAMLLSLAGVECDAPFFGSDVLGLPETGGRAFVQHNYDLGMMDDRYLAILGLRKAATTYERLEDDNLKRVPSHGDLELDAAAVFQTAQDLYESGHLNTGSGR